MQYNFEWNPKKAKINIKKHKVCFDDALTIFRDPKAISIYDVDHSKNEDRWITLGLTLKGALVVVHHIYEKNDKKTVSIRIISSRKATANEKKNYSRSK